jgi:hypothetical protein
MNTPHQRDESIFGAGFQLALEQRASYLDKACAGDAQLRRRVEALLQAHEQAGHFMTEPVPPSLGATVQISPESLSVSEKPGSRIGHYELLQEIGEGGGGVVDMAEQQEPIPGDSNGDAIVEQSELDAVLVNYWPSSLWLYLTNTAGLGGTTVTFALTNSIAWIGARTDAGWRHPAMMGVSMRGT